MRFKFILYWLGLHKQNPGQRKQAGNPALAEVATKSTSWNKEKTPNKASCLIQPGLTYQSLHLKSETWNTVLMEEQEDQIPNEPGLIILNLASWTGSQPNLSQNTQRSPYQYVLKLENSLTKFPNHMLFSISKQSFSKLAGQAMPMTKVLTSVLTPTDKTNSNILPQEKVMILSESVVGLSSFPMSLRRESFHSHRSTSIKAWK